MENKLKQIEEYARNALKIDKTGHDWEHTKRMWSTALKLAKNYPKADLKIITASCLLHDIAFENGYVKDHHIVGAIKAKEILEKLNFQKNKIPLICKAIEQHAGALLGNTNSKGMSIEAKIIRDADNIDALGAIGIIRLVNFANSQNFPAIISKKDKLNDSLYGSLKVLIDYPNRMLTNEAKEIAIEKVKLMKKFAKNIEKEVL